MPCFSNIFFVIFEISASMPGPPIWPKNSTTVTSDPNRDQTEPYIDRSVYCILPCILGNHTISRPIMPPPMTTILFGTDSRAIAPVLVTTLFSSIVSPGNGVASLPVAIMIFFALSVCSVPSIRLTWTSFSPEKAPVPGMYSTLFFLNRNSTPFVSPSTEVFFAAIICFRLSFTSPTSIPRFFVSCRI